MKIKTITCHDVYNLGASLQAFALADFLKDCDHDVQIIDYKPDYLSRHYSLTWVSNPQFDRPVLRELYLLAKLPGRLKARKSLRKRCFDAFRVEYLPLTDQRYRSAVELRQNCPDADVYIAGSDQIWNPVFLNGKDPAFFLEFVPEDRRKISYAASFSVDKLSDDDRERMQPWLSRLDEISVREASGVNLLRSMELDGIQVMDPVFLLASERWESIAVYPNARDYILVYDFDHSVQVQSIAVALAEKTGKKIISVFPMENASEVWSEMGPREFLGAVWNAGIVLSNSFHATAFSLIFRKEFYVVNREEKINTRMQDLLASVSLGDRLISTVPENVATVRWFDVQILLDELTKKSKNFLYENIR